MSKHTDLIDKVNDAKTEYDHRYADAFLQGWRDGMLDAGDRSWSFFEADQHTFTRFGDRPMCCGVLLDWKPAA